MRCFSIGIVSVFSALVFSACDAGELESSTSPVNELVVDEIADLPRKEVSECLAAAEWIHFYTRSLGQDIVHTTAIKDHWIEAYKQAFSVESVSPKSVLKNSDFRLDQNGLNEVDQLEVREVRVATCMAYTSEALRRNGFEVNMGDAL